MLRPAAVSFFILLALGLSAPGLAQPTQPAAAPNDEEVIVHPRSEAAMRGFVNEVTTVPRRGDRQLGRWVRPICFAVTGVSSALRRINNDWAALADYVSLVSLTQLDPNADTSHYPTILNLFSEPGAPRSMTEWDVAYLHGVYSMTRDAASAVEQQGQIAHRMNSELNHN
jgi:hypothetical protein